MERIVNEELNKLKPLRRINIAQINRFETFLNNISSIILNKSLSRSVRNFAPLSDRVMLLQLAMRPINVNIVQVYAPTTDHNDDEVEKFYQQIKDIMKATKKHEITLILGDWNAKVGRETVRPRGT